MVCAMVLKVRKCTLAFRTCGRGSCGRGFQASAPDRGCHGGERSLEAVKHTCPESWTALVAWEAQAVLAWCASEDHEGFSIVLTWWTGEDSVLQCGA